MGRTTDEWAALLDGTTEGPWEVETVPEMRYYGGETWEAPGKIVVYTDEARLFVAADEFVGDEGDEHDNEKNVRLAAAAPDAVAEVIRLRREVEELREVFVRAAEMMGKFEIPADRQQAQGFAGRITRILEGTHE